MSKTRVAVIQMVSTEKLEKNLESAAALITQASQGGAEFCLLPENFPLMGMEEQDKLTIREIPGQGPIQSFLANEARRHHLWIMGREAESAQGLSGHGPASGAAARRASRRGRRAARGRS